MAQQHTQSGIAVGVRPFGDEIFAARTTAILKAEQLEIVRLVLHAGQSLREHSTPGEITALCLEGRIEFRTGDVLQVLSAGDFIHLRRREPHALRALSDASALLTICLVAD